MSKTTRQLVEEAETEVHRVWRLVTEIPMVDVADLLWEARARLKDKLTSWDPERDEKEPMNDTDMITSHIDLAGLYEVGMGIMARIELRIRRAVYKATECGASFSLHDGGVSVGSIVEGSDSEVEPAELRYPFSVGEWRELIRGVEEEASTLWEEAHKECDHD